jgi:NADH-quinone oxidoreductase subunit N
MDTSQLLTFNELWRSMGPELVLGGSAFIIMIVEMILPKGQKEAAAWLSVLALLLSGVVAIARLGVPLSSYSISSYFVDGFGGIFKILILLSTLLVILLAMASKKSIKLPFEYTYLILFASTGAMVITSAVDLITLYVGLELLSIATYVLVALYRKDSRSSEGGIKYLIIGSIASATILYGLSFLVGVTGATNLATIATALQSAWNSQTGMLYLSMILVLIGIGIKVSAVPFHLWTADVYEGAPTPITAYLAVISKAAVLALALRLFIQVYGNKAGDWSQIILWLSIITMVIGNFGALAQRNVKRLLAYSSIGQLGYLLVPFATLGGTASVGDLWQSLSAEAFYLFAYAFMTIGAFAVLAVVAHEQGSEEVNAFAGLYKRSPVLAGAMGLFLLSLAGLPLTGGFYGKFLIFLTAFNAGQYALGVILFATSAVAFYYYFGILRAMFTREPEEDKGPMKVPAMMHVVLLFTVVGTLVLGIFPQTLVHVLNNLHWFG